jgi:hypothetical protein
VQLEVDRELPGELGGRRARGVSDAPESLEAREPELFLGAERFGGAEVVDGGGACGCGEEGLLVGDRSARPFGEPSERARVDRDDLVVDEANVVRAGLFADGVGHEDTAAMEAGGDGEGGGLEDMAGEVRVAAAVELRAGGEGGGKGGTGRRHAGASGRLSSVVSGRGDEPSYSWNAETQKPGVEGQ